MGDTTHTTRNVAFNFTPIHNNCKDAGKLETEGVILADRERDLSRCQTQTGSESESAETCLCSSSCFVYMFVFCVRVRVRFLCVTLGHVSSLRVIQVIARGTSTVTRNRRQLLPSPSPAPSSSPHTQSKQRHTTTVTQHTDNTINNMFDRSVVCVLVVCCCVLSLSVSGQSSDQCSTATTYNDGYGQNTRNTQNRTQHNTTIV